MVNSTDHTSFSFGLDFPIYADNSRYDDSNRST
jgi:hypothetical protein